MPEQRRGGQGGEHQRRAEAQPVGEQAHREHRFLRRCRAAPTGRRSPARDRARRSRSSGRIAASSAATQITPPPVRASSARVGPDRERDRASPPRGRTAPAAACPPRRPPSSSSAEIAAQEGERARLMRAKSARSSSGMPGSANGWCEAITAMPPPPQCSATSASTSRAPPASRPLSGSSSSQIGAPAPSSRAIAARLRWPVERIAHRHVEQVGQAQPVPSASSAAPSSRAQKRQRLAERQMLVERQAFVEQRRSRRRARPSRRRAAAARRGCAAGSTCRSRWRPRPAAPRPARARKLSPRNSTRSPRRQARSSAARRQVLHRRGAIRDASPPDCQGGGRRTTAAIVRPNEAQSSCACWVWLFGLAAVVGSVVGQGILRAPGVSSVRRAIRPRCCSACGRSGRCVSLILARCRLPSWGGDPLRRRAAGLCRAAPSDAGRGGHRASMIAADAVISAWPCCAS